MNTDLIDMSKIKLSGIRYEVLPEGFVYRIVTFKEALKEVETSSLEETVSNFQRDLSPEGELLIWENIANLYLAEIKKKSDTKLEFKKKMFEKILKSTMFGIPDTKVGV